MRFGAMKASGLPKVEATPCGVRGVVSYAAYTCTVLYVLTLTVAPRCVF